MDCRLGDIDHRIDALADRVAALESARTAEPHSPADCEGKPTADGTALDDWWQVSRTGLDGRSHGDRI